MSVELPLRIDALTGGELLEIYKIFCEIYGIDVNEHDEWYFREQGPRHLLGNFGIDYRPYMGAKFFGSGSPYVRITRFHGYSDPEDPRQMYKDRRFERSLMAWFNERFDQNGNRKRSVEGS